MTMYLPDFRPGSKVVASRTTDAYKKGAAYKIKYNTIRGMDIC